MKRLSLLRHADALPQQAGGNDHDRPLSAFGLRQANQLAASVAATPNTWDACLSSTATRALTTAQLVCAALNPPLVIISNSHLYTFNVDQLLQELESLDDTLNHPLIVGHNPAISELLHYLCTTEHGSVATATLVTLELTTDHWLDIHRECAKILQS